MRKLLYISLVLLAAGCKQSEQPSLEVDGNVKNAEGRVVYLEESSLANLQPVLIDSAVLEKDGSFHLKTLTREESIFSLRLERDQFPFVSFINDEQKITVNADMKSGELYTVKGSPASQALREYVKGHSDRMQRLYLRDKELDSLSRAKAADSLVALRSEQRMALARDLKQYTQKVINESKSPALILYALGGYQAMASNPGYRLEGFTQEEVNKIIDRTAKKYPDHQSLASLNKSLKAPPSAAEATPEITWLNKPAPDFTMPDVNGKPVSLSSFRGKYVLVDFWASWCGPCRQENPTVVQAYNKFRGKNFTVLGVSLDRPDGRDKWVQAIKEDGLAWTHVSDLKFWNSPIVGTYGFDGIPYNVLVDPKGVVIAERLRGPALEQKLSEVLQ